jgi:hypothetical protein
VSTIHRRIRRLRGVADARAGGLEKQRAKAEPIRAAVAELIEMSRAHAAEREHKLEALLFEIGGLL